jgi:hypothetical protein
MIEPKKEVKITVDEEVSTVILGDAIVEISADGRKITAYVEDNKSVRPCIVKAAGKKITGVSISEDFNTVVLNGITIEQTKDGALTIKTPGFSNFSVTSKTAFDEGLKTESNPLRIGDKMADGTVYAGLTVDGQQQIFAMPADLSILMTFNDAVKAVKKLNDDKTFGYNDWEIPTLEALRVLQKNRNKGALKGSFKTLEERGDFGYSDWYWSSSEHRNNPISCEYMVHSSGGYVERAQKDDLHLSCRPVRLVPVT